MKNTPIILLILLCLLSCNTGNQKILPVKTNISIQEADTTDMTNNFYDNSETTNFTLADLYVEGEISNPGKVNFDELPVHSVIVKETLLDSAGGDRFTGAYRYDGYSLFDILDKKILNKINSAEFNPIIDLYIEVENKNGEKVIFSWGEIYYPVNLHKIIIARSVSRIVPSKTKELWPLPVSSKIVAANDLDTERNIYDPVKITVKSVHKTFPVSKGLTPMYCSEFKLFSNEKLLTRLSPSGSENIIFNTIFYGRGKGIHSTSPFKGLILKDILLPYFPFVKNNLQSGLLCLVGKDGYRCAVSYSELFNRNDQQEFLLVRTEPDEDGGLFRVFAAPDFFSDRAIKSLSEVVLILPQAAN